VGFGKGVSSSPMGMGSGERAVSPPQKYFIFELKMMVFGAFCMLFFNSSAVTPESHSFLRSQSQALRSIKVNSNKLKLWVPNTLHKVLLILLTHMEPSVSVPMV